MNTCVECGSECKNKFCNNECSGKYFGRQYKSRAVVRMKCEYCHTEFEKVRSSTKRFCSRSCWISVSNIASRKTAPTFVCKTCGNVTENFRSLKSPKYCSKACQAKSRWIRLVEKIESGDSTVSSVVVRRYLIAKYGARCMVCGWSAIHTKTGKVPIQLNHKDGHYKNCALSNVELLCPNCHSLTPNFGSLNNGNGREYRYKMPV